MSPPIATSVIDIIEDTTKGLQSPGTWRHADGDRFTIVCPGCWKEIHTFHASVLDKYKCLRLSCKCRFDRVGRMSDFGLRGGIE